MSESHILVDNSDPDFIPDTDDVCSDSSFKLGLRRNSFNNSGSNKVHQLNNNVDIVELQ